MHRISAKHRTLGHFVVGLDARDPSLDNVPLAVDSVPVAGPLVSPLLENGDGGSTQPSTSPDPQPAPTSTAGDGGSGGDGGGSTPTPTASPASGGGTTIPPESIVSSPNSPTSTPGNPSSSSSANITTSGSGNNNSSSTASSSGPGIGGNFVDVSVGQSTPVNAGTGSSTATSAALGMSISGAIATGISSPSQYSLGSGPNVVGTTSPSPTITTSTSISSGKQLSGSAIAGIVIVCLFFLLALILVVVRRRSIARRVELRRQWLFGHHASGGNSSLVNNESPRSLVASRGETPTSRPSSCSSFATNFDHGLMLSIGFPSRHSLGVFPHPPPTAEVRERNSILISTGAAAARRETMNSMLSNGNDPDAQYLTVPGHDNSEPPTPMSVRPFSPSESFAFPKPPAPLSSAADSFFFSGTQGSVSPRSSATLIHLSTPPRAFITDLPPALVSTPSLYHQVSGSNISRSSSTASANTSVHPFTDPEKSGFADVEVIRRPFKPSLDDELAVCPGDRVRLRQLFDDGWAFIEKLASTEEERHEQGLIPIDCLREVSQALPTFLDQKRVSSYGWD